MKEEHPFSQEYKKAMMSKIQLVEKLVADVKEHYTIDFLEALQKEVHKIGANAQLYGYDDIGSLCQKLEYDIISNIKNFYFSKPGSQWFIDLDGFLVKLKESFEPDQQGARVIPEEKPRFEPKLVTSPGTILSKKAAASKKETKRRIVIVDDDEDILKLLDFEFREIGFDILTFKTGGAALTFFQDSKNLNDVNLLILDRMLPDMDGLDILQKLSEQLDHKVPVLILSALDAETDIIAGLQGGAVDYITKPFSVFILLQKAVNLIKTERN